MSHEGAADSGVEWIAHKHWNICVMRVASNRRFELEQTDRPSDIPTWI
jgi:hypothetical protein